MAYLTLVTPPSVDTEPITLAEAKAHCRVDIDDDDALIAGLIPAARQHLELVTGRQFITATWALGLDGWPCWIDVPRAPLLGVTSIAYLDSDGTSQTLASNQYRVTKPAGPTAPRGRIEPEYGVSWPSVRCVSDAITVTFTAGYGAYADAVPAPLRQAMLLLIGHWYINRESVIVGESATEMPQAIKSLVAPFKTWARQ